jgi:hypothetical protein
LTATSRSAATSCGTKPTTWRRFSSGTTVGAAGVSTTTGLALASTLQAKEGTHHTRRLLICPAPRVHGATIGTPALHTPGAPCRNPPANPIILGGAAAGGTRTRARTSTSTNTSTNTNTVCSSTGGSASGCCSAVVTAQVYTRVRAGAQDAGSRGAHDTLPAQLQGVEWTTDEWMGLGGTSVNHPTSKRNERAYETRARPANVPKSPDEAHHPPLQPTST